MIPRGFVFASLSCADQPTYKVLLTIVIVSYSHAPCFNSVLESEVVGLGMGEKRRIVTRIV
jgi:hypothetical protein